jgi:hypothetical protein
MRHFLPACWIAAAIGIVLLSNSTGQADFCRRAYYYPACCPTAAPVAGQATAQASCPVVYTTQMQVLPASYGQAIAPAAGGQVCYPQYQYQGTMGGGGNMPRSSWDYGRWPPY